MLLFYFLLAFLSLKPVTLITELHKRSNVLVRNVNMKRKIIIIITAV